MAISNITDRFNTIIMQAQRKFTGDYLRRTSRAIGSSKVIMLEIQIGGDALVQSGIEGIENIIKKDAEKTLTPEGVEFLRTANQSHIWAKIVNEKLKEIGTSKRIGNAIRSIKSNSELQKTQSPEGFYRGKPFYIKDGVANAITLITFGAKEDGRMTGKVDEQIRDAIKHIAEHMFEKWFDAALGQVGQGNLFAQSGFRDNIGRSQSGQARDYRQKFRDRFKQEHAADTTTALYALNDIRNQSLDYNGDYKFQAYDIQNAVLDKTGVDWQQDIKKEGEKYTIDSKIKFRIGPNPRLPTDITGPGGGVKKLAEKFIRSQILDEAQAKGKIPTGVPGTGANLGGLFSLDFMASVPPRKQIADDAVVTIAKTIKKNLKSKKNLKVTTKIKAKPLKSKGRKAKIKTKSKGRISLGGATVAVAGKIASKGKGGRSPRPKNADATLDMLKLKKQINKRLPTAVKQNMGRPALINQTGRFAESAEVVRIKPSAKTLVADYTYQLNPYETFENTGDKQWPAGYNPKPLIAKSIREVAQAAVDEKFILRRV